MMIIIIIIIIVDAWIVSSQSGERYDDDEP